MRSFYQLSYRGPTRIWVDWRLPWNEVEELLQHYKHVGTLSEHQGQDGTNRSILMWSMMGFATWLVRSLHMGSWSVPFPLRTRCWLQMKEGLRGLNYHVWCEDSTVRVLESDDQGQGLFIRFRIWSSLCKVSRGVTSSKRVYKWLIWCSPESGQFLPHIEVSSM